MIKAVNFLMFQFARFQWVREYYFETHFQINLRGCVLTHTNNEILGYLESAQVKNGRLYLRGWTLANSISFRLGCAQVTRSAQDERNDVAQAFGCERHVGFQASLPFEPATLVIELKMTDCDVQLRHDLGIKRAKQQAHRKLNTRFICDLIPLVPGILFGAMRRDPDLPRRVKAALRLGLPQEDALVNGAFLSSESAPSEVENRPIANIIMPIHDAMDVFPEALRRLCAHTRRPFQVILIEDCSGDDRVRPWLRAWVAQAGAEFAITLIENDRNLGFIGSVNLGLSHVREGNMKGPIVLVNSDALVPQDWLDRLLAPLAKPDVASVTPLSNDAEIFGAPVLCRATGLAAGQADHIDCVLKQHIAHNAPQIYAPTGVGFCMALAQNWVEKLGGFDPVFGRGYGEEVDWCRRAAAYGGKHVAAPNLFVEHRGGASFGTDKLSLVQRNNAIISARYPGYDRMVQDFIRTDPLITARLIAALAWADSLADVSEIPVFIAHSMGGGAEHYLQDRIRKLPVSIVLRFGGHFRCRIELDSLNGRMVANCDTLDIVLRLMACVSKRRIIYSCAVGDPDLTEIPVFLERLAQSAPLDLMFHDYLPLSPCYTLLDQDGVYRGVPTVTNTDPAHYYHSASGSKMQLSEWRMNWARAVTAAEKLIVFSTSSAVIVDEVFPDAAGKIAIVPHSLLQTVPCLPRPKGTKRVVGVLGAIGPQKGAAVVAALAKALEHEPDMGLALIGRIAPGYPLGEKVPIHGTYVIEDIPVLAARYGVTHWLIPSIWPETFSYTAHECLATGLPTLAFDLGAQGEAVAKAVNGYVLPWTSGARKPEQLVKLILTALRRV